MAKVHMKRIEIIALLTDGKSVVERLQRRGAVDLLQYEETGDGKKAERISTGQSVQIFEKNAALVKQALAVLEEYAPQKKPLLSSFEPRTAISTEQFEAMASKAEASIIKSNELTKLAQKISENKAGLKSNRQYAELLESWRALEVPMRFTGTAQTAAFIGTLPGAWDRETLLEQLKTEPGAPLPAEAQIVYSYSVQSGIFVLCHKEYEEECSRALRKLGFSLPSNMTAKPPAEVIAEYGREADRLEREIESLTVEIMALSSLRQQLNFTLDYLSMRIDKYRALENLALTRSTMIMIGYIPEDKAESLAAELEEKYTISVSVKEPSEEEEPPVAFKNVMPAAALEDITESYSIPSKSDVDPNAVMAVFYYALFGLMLSDAGYGLLLALACGLILKFKKPEGNIMRNMQKFMLCGLSTVFWGALFGSWFGSFVLTVNLFGHNIRLSPLWFDPVARPMDLLVFSLIIGFIQVVVGLGVKFYTLWRSGKKLDAIFDVGFWWVVFAGILCIIASSLLPATLPLKNIGIVIALAGTAGLLLTQGRDAESIFGKIMGGFGGLYGITGYFSDVLSYCRLMALGLVTGIIGTVVNTIGGIGGKGIFGTVLFVLVFIFGHSVNLGINALGAYVHCNRLQYVEFFNKFYEGGGRLFTPLKVNTKHYKFEEEHTNV